MRRLVVFFLNFKFIIWKCFTCIQYVLMMSTSHFSPSAPPGPHLISLSTSCVPFIISYILFNPLSPISASHRNTALLWGHQLGYGESTSGHSIKEKQLCRYQLLLSWGRGQDSLAPSPCPGALTWLGLVRVMCRSPQLQWVHVCSSCMVSGGQLFTTLCHLLGLFHSFQPLLHELPWAWAGIGDGYQCLLMLWVQGKENLFSAFWTVLLLCIQHDPLQSEASLTWEQSQSGCP